MVQLQAALRQRGLPSYIFSNTNELAVEHIRQSFPFFAKFDGYILSYEHGVMKPDAALYEVVERKCGRRGAEILYLDDRPENVDAGAARGWQVILQESPEKTLGGRPEGLACSITTDRAGPSRSPPAAPPAIVRVPMKKSRSAMSFSARRVVSKRSDKVPSISVNSKRWASRWSLATRY